MLDCYNKDQTSLRDKRLFEITKVEIKRVDCISLKRSVVSHGSKRVIVLPVSVCRGTQHASLPPLKD